MVYEFGGWWLVGLAMNGDWERKGRWIRGCGMMQRGERGEDKMAVWLSWGLGFGAGCKS